MALTLYDPGPSYTKFDQIEGLTEEERSFLRIVDVNAFGNSSEGNSGLYATICRINHSCSPNAYHVTDEQAVMEVGTITLACLIWWETLLSSVSLNFKLWKCQDGHWLDLG